MRSISEFQQVKIETLGHTIFTAPMSQPVSRGSPGELPPLVQDDRITILLNLYTFPALKVRITLTFFVDILESFILYVLGGKLGETKGRQTAIPARNTQQYRQKRLSTHQLFLSLQAPYRGSISCPVFSTAAHFPKKIHELHDAATSHNAVNRADTKFTSNLTQLR